MDECDTNIINRLLLASYMQLFIFHFR